MVLGKHTSKNISFWIKSCFQDWKIKPWLRINDNAHNMGFSLTLEMKELDLHCSTLLYVAHWI